MSGSVQTAPPQSQTRLGTTGPQPMRVTLGSSHTSNHRSYPAQGHTTSCNRSVCYDQVKACNHDGESVAKAQSVSQSNNAFRPKTLTCALRTSHPRSNFLLFEWMIVVHSPTLKMEAGASEKRWHLPIKLCGIGSQQNATFKNKIYVETPLFHNSYSIRDNYAKNPSYAIPVCSFPNLFHLQIIAVCPITNTCRKQRRRSASFCW